MNPKSKIASFFNALCVNFRHLKFISKTEMTIKQMGPSEKVLFYLICIVFVISGSVMLLHVHNSFLVEVPAFGGSFSEGLVGSPRFINPVLAISDTDKDLVTLIYSGLLKAGENGTYKEDLASFYEVRENGLVYNFVIRDNAYFHDGKEVMADDVIFTIEKILDPVIKSPKKANWEGVAIEKVNGKEVQFILSKPYAPFIQALTIGILPKHIWENVSSEEFPFSQFNINPVGSGPYKVEKITRNSGGIPTVITLSAWKKYSLGSPKIKSITFKFFQNENDLFKAHEESSVEGVAGLSPETAQRLDNGKNILSEASLPRVFGVFLNQNVAPVFLNAEIRDALDLATPKTRIVSEVLRGFGRVLNGPTPVNAETDEYRKEGDVEAAKSMLIKAGWKENEEGILEKKTKAKTDVFSFAITTSDAPELKQTAEILKEAWTRLGAQVDIKVFEAGDLSQNIIKGRKYEALLFGEVVGEDSDLYPFWHSSARNDPGLNISLYANITVDKMLEDIQGKIENGDNDEKKEVVFAEIKKDTPAIFLFSPYLLYLPSTKVKNVSIKDVSSQNERFLFVTDWFIETDKVWEIFANNY